MSYLYEAGIRLTIKFHLTDNIAEEAVLGRYRYG
jgi:hypothetical protein